MNLRLYVFFNYVHWKILEGHLSSTSPAQILIYNYYFPLQEIKAPWF